MLNLLFILGGYTKPVGCCQAIRSTSDPSEGQIEVNQMARFHFFKVWWVVYGKSGHSSPQFFFYYAFIRFKAC